MTLITREAVTRRAARYQAGDSRPADRPSRGSSRASSRTISTAAPARNSSGNGDHEQVDLGDAGVQGDRVAAAQPQPAAARGGQHQQLPGHERDPAAAGADRPFGRGPRPQPGDQGEQAEPGDERDQRGDRRPATARPRPAAGDGPSRATSQRASSQPSTVPTTAGSASSSTALSASAAGPTPREDSSRTSRGPAVGPVRAGRPDQQQRQDRAAQRDRQHRSAQTRPGSARCARRTRASARCRS